MFWSEQRSLLIFPYYIEGTLVGWQGRYFGTDPKHPKWFSKGKLDSFVYTLGKESDTIVLTEDIVSAIKVSSLQKSSPIFGSVISKHRFLALTHICKNVIIWLDPDKQKEAVKFANLGRLFGLNCSVILSAKDPKEHTYDEIRKLLNI